MSALSNVNKTSWLVGLVLGVLGMAVIAAPNSRPFALDHTEVIDFHAVANDKDYEVYIRLPASYAHNPTQHYPLVLLIDGYYAFPLVSAINWRMSERHDEMQESILVGISYAKGDDIDDNRGRDFTPSIPPNKHNTNAGGASQYAVFLAQELLPYVLQHYRVDTHRKIFSGHSYGGLLGAYLLFTQPQLFDYYLLGSPSLWYDQRVIFRLEADYAKQHKDLPAKVFMATGAQENDSEYAMLKNMFELQKILNSRHYPSLTLEAKSLSDENHLSGYPAFITQGLLWALPASPPKN